MEGIGADLCYAGTCKDITVILIGITFFDGVPTSRVALGTLTAVGAILIYTNSTLNEKARKDALDHSVLRVKDKVGETVHRYCEV